MEVQGVVWGGAGVWGDVGLHASYLTTIALHHRLAASMGTGFSTGPPRNHLHPSTHRHRYTRTATNAPPPTPSQHPLLALLHWVRCSLIWNPQPPPGPPTTTPTTPTIPYGIGSKLTPPPHHHSATAHLEQQHTQCGVAELGRDLAALAQQLQHEGAAAHGQRGANHHRLVHRADGHQPVRRVRNLVLVGAWGRVGWLGRWLVGWLVGWLGGCEARHGWRVEGDGVWGKAGRDRIGFAERDARVKCGAGARSRACCVLSTCRAAASRPLASCQASALYGPDAAINLG